MPEKIFHIKVNSSETNKDKGFSALICSGTSIACLKDDEYFVTKSAIKSLNEKRVMYKIVPKKSISIE